ncbi:MAG: sigma 54-interacting transcriptional regulator [Deltaproteobacteria bacterium]|jgi:two-component system NtrC family response regulator|nr:sigma 54-interacting transcriptional regulator [Deltaproteobacteria bacterium]
MTDKILIVDDEPNYQLVIGEMLEAEGYRVLTAGSGDEAFRIFAGDPEVDLVLTDMTMPNGSGIELLDKVRGMRPEVPVIMLTAHGTVELAVRSMKQGAFDYLTKPYKNDELTRTVAKALELSHLGRQNKELKEALERRHSFGSLIGKSKPMLELYTLLEKVAPTRTNILITGESGTGKELVARAVHYNSTRRDGPFVAVNCSALAAGVLESELFGHEKGAFTGAGQARTGRFEMAHGGTLFLDEVGEMGQDIQVKLLRSIQERYIERVGGGSQVKVDVRIVAATNRDLREEVAAGRFREDLYYRLNVVHVPLPPLRDRMDDLPLLTAHFLSKHAQEGAPLRRLHQDTLRLMYAHRWPGNVRELENVIERGLVLSAGDFIMPGDLPPEVKNPAPAVGAPGPPPRAAAGAANPAPEGPPPCGGTDAAPAPSGPRPAPPGGPGGEGGPGLPEGSGPRSDPGHWAWRAVAAYPPEPGRLSLPDALLAIEEGILHRAMDTADGIQARAADALGVKRNVFKYKWDRFASGTPSPLAAGLAGFVPEGERLGDSLDAYQEAMLVHAYRACDGSQARAAELLGLRRNHMQYKLKRFPGLVRWLETRG